MRRPCFCFTSGFNPRTASSLVMLWVSLVGSRKKSMAASQIAFCLGVILQLGGVIASFLMRSISASISPHRVLSHSLTPSIRPSKRSERCTNLVVIIPLVFPHQTVRYILASWSCSSLTLRRRPSSLVMTASLGTADDTMSRLAESNAAHDHAPAWLRRFVPNSHMPHQLHCIRPLIRIRHLTISIHARQVPLFGRPRPGSPRPPNQSDGNEVERQRPCSARDCNEGDPGQTIAYPHHLERCRKHICAPTPGVRFRRPMRGATALPGRSRRPPRRAI